MRNAKLFIFFLVLIFYFSSSYFIKNIAKQENISYSYKLIFLLFIMAQLILPSLAAYLATYKNRISGFIVFAVSFFAIGVFGIFAGVSNVIFLEPEILFFSIIGWQALVFIKKIEDEKTEKWLVYLKNKKLIFVLNSAAMMFIVFQLFYFLN